MQKSGRSDNPASANHRTGTLPFMAIDLLYARTWGHLYRYDLESCVYILVWGMVHYDLKVGQRVTKVHEALRGWVVGAMNSRTSLARDQIHDAVQPKFAPFWEKYVEPLLELLSKLQCQVQRAKEKA
jgi:predicted N-acyltransferase